VKIVEMRIHAIAIADPPLLSSYGLHAPYALRTILELHSDDGIVGIAETHGGEAILAGFEMIKPQVIGKDPYRLAGLLMSMIEPEVNTTSFDRSQTYHVPGENPLDESARLHSAIEIACLDLIGKSVKQPVCDLLGGRARTNVPFSAYAFYKRAGGGGEGTDARKDEYGEALTPEAIVGQVKQMIQTYRFHDIKLKGGVFEPNLEIEAIRQLRNEFGSKMPLRLDPNCAWTVKTSVQVGLSLADEMKGGGYLEDPTAEIAGMAAARRELQQNSVSTPLASNVAVTSFADLPEITKEDAVQIVLCDPHYWGGLRQVQHLGKICRTFGLGLSMHSNSHLGVSLMAMAHAAASVPNLTYACDTHYPWQYAEDEVVATGRIPIVDGCVVVPDKPGLGVELDYDQLARGEERYKRCSYRKRDDEGEMRKHVDSNWKRIPQRW